MPVVINMIAFQIGWFASVIGGAQHWPWLGVCVVALVAAVHLGRAVRPGIEALLLLTATMIGTLWEGLLVGFGLIRYPSGLFADWLPPIWIVALWVVFASTLNVSLRWLRGRWRLAMVMGAIGGPMAFAAGERLGAATFPDPVLSLTVIGAGWALMTPLLVWLAERLDGYAPASRATPDAAAVPLAEADPHV
ncbi:DUF2878 domain-containing protein [Thioalkalicoccus limnaeus]|uniref:DUF2878 domain-containing protein n=1 Tax=Thioalkalicoccus limnaeus TaxID=120681 RepID=A0ABV4BFT9_9GAMM